MTPTIPAHRPLSGLTILDLTNLLGGPEVAANASDSTALILLQMLGFPTARRVAR
ncbi:MAG: hypothetical protein ABI777_11245 [Betaproteobacteria bacterium]